MLSCSFRNAGAKYVTRSTRGARRAPVSVFAVLCMLLLGCPPSDHDEEDAAATAHPEEKSAVVQLGGDVEGKRPKNFILISMDTVRADHLSCYGYERRTTPRLDAYAERGALFLNCTSPSAWTIPSHMSIITGVEPPAHRCIYYQDVGRINEKFETMPKIFRRHGFRTGAFTGGGFMSQRYGMFEGFEKFSSRGTHFANNLPDVWRWIDEVGEAPMFLFLHGFDAHKPYMPPTMYRTRFGEPYSGTYPIAGFCKPGAPKPDPIELKHVVAQYDGEIAAIDDVIGDFLDELDKRGVLDETLVVITTDHGDEFFERGNCDHIHSLYDELVRAAWIMIGPSVPPVEVRDHVGTIDILPTVLELFEIDVDAKLQGTSRVSALTHHGEPRDSRVFSFTGRGSEPFHLSSVRTQRWKLITDLPAGRRNRNCAVCMNGGHDEIEMRLYDLQADPGEQHDLSDQYPEFTYELLGRIQDRIAESRELGLETVDPPAESQEDIERLRSLGYIE